MRVIHVIDGRFEVRLISSGALAQYMAHRDHTVRSLAAAVTHELKKKDRDANCSAALVGHLRSGARNTCRATTAGAIEKVLQAPTGSLFVPRVSHVSCDARVAA